MQFNARTIFMRRPLVIVAILYACGVLLAEFVPLPLKSLFGIALVLAALTLVWRGARTALLIPLVIVTGWVGFTCSTTVVSPNDLRVILPKEPAEASVRGRLTETPSVRLSMREDAPVFRTLAEVRVTEVKVNDEWQPAYGRIMTMTPGDLEGFAHHGSEVELRGVISRPDLPVAEGLFNYRAYLARQNIYYQLRTGGTNEWTLLAPATPGLGDRFLQWSKHILGRGLPERDEPLLLLYAMTLGWKTGLVNEVYEPFMYSGTMHIFAISGLHVALIAGILVALLRLVRVPRNWCGAILIPSLWFYTAATGWQPSAIRSTIMMSVILFGWSLARPTDLINSLAAAALLILVWDPQQLFQASFQLSFSVVLSIALLTPPVVRFCDFVIRHDPLIPHDALPWWRRWLETTLRWLMLSVATSFAAWLGALPLTAYYFNVLSPVTLLANLIVIPLSSAALASNLGSLMCGTWLPVLGDWFNHGAWFWMKLMLDISRWSAQLPHAYRFVAAPPLWTFAAYYLMLVGLFSGWFFRSGNRVWGLLALLAITVGGYVEWQRAQDKIELTVIPVHGGHIVHVDAPGTGNDWLIDCGDSNSVERVTIPFLHARGVNQLPRLALTHGDAQHTGGAQLLCDEIGVDKIFTSAATFRSPLYREFVNGLADQPGLHEEVARGTNLGLWTVLHPAGDDKSPQADDASLVLQGRLHKTRLLLLGDLGRPGQELLMQRYPYLDSDIVVTGLPEKGEAFCNGLVASAHPRLTVIADSEYPATKRASRVLEQRLSNAGAHAVFTRKRGAVTITISPEGTKVRSAWESELP
jgi:competence protein ComEC